MATYSELVSQAQALMAQAEQVRSIDVSRVGRLLGTLPDDLSRAIDDALRVHLALA